MATEVRTLDRPVVPLVVALCALTLGVVLAVGLLRVADDPFGRSHDGENGAVWSAAAGALRADPIASKLGAIHADGTVYANHPPLIIVETAAAEALLGQRQWARRAPAWMGTIVAVVLMALVLRREGLSPTARAVGCLLGFGTPMVMTYGAMLDTPVTSLPFGLLCLLAWQRARDGEAASWERPVTCGLAVMAGWQVALLAVLTLAVGRSWRAAIGVVGAALAVFAWQLWVHGSVIVLLDAFRGRSGVGFAPFSPWKVAANQGRWLVTLITPASLIVGAGGLLLALRDRQRLAMIVVAASVLYPLGTLSAAGVHDYWLYWLAVPLALGGAMVADAGTVLTVDLRRVALVTGLTVAAYALTVQSPAALIQDSAVKDLAPGESLEGWPF